MHGKGGFCDGLVDMRWLALLKLSIWLCEVLLPQVLARCCQPRITVSLLSHALQHFDSLTGSYNVTMANMTRVVSGGAFVDGSGAWLQAAEG